MRIAKPRRRACFFARVKDRTLLDHVGFYAQDIAALRESGYEVTVATRPWEIPWNSDLYFAWWWTYALLPALVAKLRRKPIIVTGVFNLSWGYGDYLHRSRLQRLVLRTAFRLATLNVMVSRLETAQIADLEWSTRVHYSPLGVDTDLYVPAGQRSDSIIATIAWLHGENAARKGIPDLILAMPDILRARPDARLIIAGEQGSAYARLCELADSLGVAHAIDWPGRISEAEKIQLMQQCSLYVQPSVYEGFGLAVLEAMSCGSPIIATMVGELPEVVGDAALQLRSRDAHEIAAAVLGLLADTSKADALGRAGRTRAIRLFSLSARRAAIAEVLHSVTAGHDGG